jgi:hypothetical protein
LAGIIVSGPVGNGSWTAERSGHPANTVQHDFSWNANFTKNYSSHEFAWGPDARQQRFDLTLTGMAQCKTSILKPAHHFK